MKLDLKRRKIGVRQKYLVVN